MSLNAWLSHSIPAALLLAALPACGVIHLGSSSGASAPNAPILASGPFAGVNGQTVSGVATVYDMGNGSYVTYLESLTVPAVGGLQVITVNNGQNVSVQSLQATGDNQSYSFSAQVTGNFNQVLIFSPSANENYGIATLQQQQ